MLNIPLIQQAMQQRGLNQADLATHCEVSREAVSRWMAGESVPRPLKLKRIANTLQLEVGSLLITPPPPSFEASPSTPDAALSRADRETMLDSSWRVRELAHLAGTPCFAPKRLRAPSTDRVYIQAAVYAVKALTSTSPTGFLTTEKLVDLNIVAGTVLLVCPWQGDRNGQSQPFVVQPSSEDETWLLCGLSTSRADFDAILAYALGLQYCQGTLEGRDARAFAREFAAALAADAPPSLPHEATETIRGIYFNGELDIPVPRFIACCESTFRTPAYQALGEFQHMEGGRNPAFIASLLNVNLGEAVAWSYVLFDRHKAKMARQAIQQIG